MHDLNLIAGVVLNLQGPVTFYVTGSFSMAATVNLLGVLNANPTNLSVKVLPGGNVNFIANLPAGVAMAIYAPDSAVNITVAVGHYTGSIVAKSLSIQCPVAAVFSEVKLPGVQPENRVRVVNGRRGPPPSRTDSRRRLCDQIANFFQPRAEVVLRLRRQLASTAAPKPRAEVRRSPGSADVRFGASTYLGPRLGFDTTTDGDHEVCFPVRG